MGILRLLLALSVVLAHSHFATSFEYVPMIGGALAVQIFFIISGFYMALILDGKYSSTALFWTNRLLRLFPTYWLVAMLTLGYVIKTDPDYFRRLAELGAIRASLVTLTNIFLVGQDFWLFLGIKNGEFFFTSDFSKTDPKLISFVLLPQAWTLALELYFYAIAPILVRATTKLLICIAIAVSIIKAVAAINDFGNDPWSYRFFPF